MTRGAIVLPCKTLDPKGVDIYLGDYRGVDAGRVVRAVGFLFLEVILVVGYEEYEISIIVGDLKHL